MAGNKNNGNNVGTDQPRDLTLIDPMFKKFLHQLGISIEKLDTPGYLPPGYDFIHEFINGPKTPQRLFFAIKKAEQSGLVAHQDWVEWTNLFKENFNIIDVVEPEVLEGAEELEEIRKRVGPVRQEEPPIITLDAKRIKAGEKEPIARGEAFYETMERINKEEDRARQTEEERRVTESAGVAEANRGDLKDREVSVDIEKTVLGPDTEDQGHRIEPKIEPVEEAEVGTGTSIVLSRREAETAKQMRQEESEVKIQLESKQEQGDLLREGRLELDEEKRVVQAKKEGTPVVLSPGRRVGEGGEKQKESVGTKRTVGSSIGTEKTTSQVELTSLSTVQGDASERTSTQQSQEGILEGRIGEEVKIAGTTTNGKQSNRRSETTTTKLEKQTPKTKKPSDLQKSIGPSVHITKQYRTDETPSAGTGGATAEKAREKPQAPGTGGATAEKFTGKSTKLSKGRKYAETYVERQTRLLGEVEEDIKSMSKVVEEQKIRKARKEAEKYQLARKKKSDETEVPEIAEIDAGRIEQMQIEYTLSRIAKEARSRGIKGKELARVLKKANEDLRKSGVDATSIDIVEDSISADFGEAIAMPPPKSYKLNRQNFSKELDKVIRKSKDYSDLEFGIDRLIRTAIDSGLPSQYVVKEVNKQYESSQWYKKVKKSEEIERAAYIGIKRSISRREAEKAVEKAKAVRSRKMTREDIEYNRQLEKFRNNFDRLASDSELMAAFEESYKKGPFSQRYKNRFGKDAEYQLQPEKIKAKIRADVENPNKPIHEDTPDIAETVEQVIGQVVEIEEVDGKPVVKNPVLDGTIFDPKNAKKRRALEKEINRQITKELTKRDVERLLSNFILPNAGYYGDLDTAQIAELTAEILANTAFDDMHEAFYKDGKLRAINDRQVLTHRQVVEEAARRIREDEAYRKAVQSAIEAAIVENEKDLSLQDAQKLAEDLTNSTVEGLEANIGSVLPARRLELAQTPDGIPVVRGDVLQTNERGANVSELPALELEGDDPVGNVRRAIERDVRIDGMTKSQIEDQINEYHRRYLEKRYSPSEVDKIMSTPIEFRDRKRFGQIWQELTESERKQYADLNMNYSGYLASQKMATSYVQNELELLSKNPIRYAFAAPFRLAFTQIAPGTLQDKVIGTHLKLTGQTDTNKAYALSRNFSVVLNNAVVTELKVATGLWSRSWNPNDPKSYYDTRNRIIDFGTKGGHWFLNKSANWLEGSVANTIAKRSVSGALLDTDYSLRNLGSRLSFGARKRSLKTLKQKKKKKLSLFMTVAKLLGGVVIETAAETLKSFNTGRRLLANIKGLQSAVGETGAGGYLQDAKLAWKHGMGLADGAKYKGFSYRLGQGLRAVSVGRGFVGAGLSTLVKGGTIFYVSTLLGVPMPVTIGLTGVYSGLNFLRYIANHPTLGMSLGENGAVNISKFATKHNFWGKIARNFNTTVPTSKLAEIEEISKLTKLSKAVSRYFPGTGLAVSTWLMALGVPAPIALGVGVGGQLGWMGFQRFLQVGKVEAFTKILGTTLGKLNAIAGIIGGIGVLEEMGGIVGGIQSLFRDGVSWNTALRAMGVAGIFIGTTVLLGGWIPGLIAGTAIVVTDQIVRWITGKGLWGNVVAPIAGDIFGFIGNKAAMLAGAAFGLLQGMMKLLTARNISQLVEAAVMTTFGLIMALGLFTTAGVVAPAYFVPSAVSFDKGNPYRTSEYFKDFSKELKDVVTVSDVPGGRDMLYYDVSYEYTGGPNGDETLYGVRGADVLEGVSVDEVDEACTMTQNPDFYRETEELTFEDRMGYVDNGAGLIAYKRLEPGEKVSKTIVICLKKKLADINLGPNGLKNTYFVEGYPSTQDITEWEERPPVIRGGDSDSRNNQGDSIGFRIPVRSPNAVITSYYGRRCLEGEPDCRFHRGVDIGGMPIGESIYPVMPGEVVNVGFDEDGYGYFVRIRHDDGYESVYGHMVAMSRLQIGDVVDYDTVIGGIGSTGHSTGPHLHLEIRLNGQTQNPCDYINCSELK